MIKRTLLSLVAAGTVLAAGAVKARPGVHRMQQPDGTTIDVILVGDEHGHIYLTPDSMPLERDAAGFLRPASASRDEALNGMRKRRSNSPRRARRAVAQSGLGVFSNSFPVTGDVKALVILVNYKDVKFKTPDAHNYFTNLLMQEGFSDYSATGSARDYFVDNSMGQFRPEFDCYGPVELPQKRSYYGGNDTWGDDKAPEDMIIHAVQQLDSEVDFSQYDTDGDGYVDNVYVFYAGEGEAGGGGDDTVWPHSFYIRSGAGKTCRADGVLFDYYACSNEWEGGMPDGIGTFVHEFSHVMGLPDLYDTEYNNPYITPASWSVLDSGNYNNNSRTPAGYGAFERNALGWNEPVLIDGPCTEDLEEIGTSNVSYIIPTEKTNEFFLLENRQKNGWDSYLPGHGMLIWHIDFNQSVWEQNAVNNTKSHQYVDIEEANGNANSRTSSNLAGYSWPGTKKKTSFTSTTTPAMKSWAGKAINLPITDIAETDGRISFNVAGGGPSSGIAAVEATPEAGLRLEGRTLAAPGAISVYDLAGRLVVAGHDAVQLPAPGIYVVSAAGATAKLSVKF